MRPLTSPTIAALLLLLLPAAAYADLDLVFTIDTTGSMGGEIREAKERVKQIAGGLAKARPNERIRIGVVAYKDRGDAYVTRVSPLSEDVETSFTFLGTLTADGGGDTPEDVISGLVVTLDQIEWDLQNAATERQVFLIGDAPPQFYEDAPALEEVITRALERRIVINTIGCRSLSAAGVEIFRRIAYGTEGVYQHIGRVSTAGADPGLAGAMLSALARDDGRAGARPLNVRSTQGVLAAADLPEHAIQVKPLAARDAREACAIRVALPRGLSLARAPVVERSDKALFVELAVAGSGAGGAAHDYTLEACFPITLPVSIRFGG